MSKFKEFMLKIKSVDTKAYEWIVKKPVHCLGQMPISSGIWSHNALAVDDVLRQYNTLESQRSRIVYVHSGSGSCAPTLCKFAPTVESGVTTLRQ
ncbi:hypothetical protein AMTR_s00016p00260110 [Amborella trichopoda]|uniref:Uncharacterized protein n=1 Tax=Amborella trichopoda TaxID=13333 RepID=W1PER8_AMBTC|nr:hypothetical protein AMTR_s00016p00260110 [Amborella trichopoda]